MSDLWSGKATEDDVVAAPDVDGGLWSGRGEPRPTRTGPGRGTQWAARILLVVLLVGVPLMLGSVVLDLLTVRSSLAEARDVLRDVRASVGEADVSAGATQLPAAKEQIADASRRSGRFTWTVTATFPVIGPSVDVTRDVVQVAATAVDVADVALRDAQELLGEGVQVEVVDGRIDLGTITRSQEILAGLPLEPLAVARDALARPRAGWLPEVIGEGRSDVLALADETIGTVERARALTEALPPFLGADGPRSYFVGLQTSAELRGTGGLIGFWGVLSVDDGQVRFGETEEYDPFDDSRPPEGETRTSRINRIGLSPRNPPAMDPAYYARYGFAAGARSFPNINLDPDLPTTGKAALDLFELQTGERLDGVILLDPTGLEWLLEAVDDEVVPLPDELSDTLGFDGGLPIEGFAQYVTSDIYEVLGFDRSDERKDALREIGDAAFDEVFDGRWASQPMAQAIVRAASERHLQIFTTHEATQDTLRTVGVTGELDAPSTVDLFALTANNAVGGKQDVHLGHEMRFDVSLDDVRLNDDGELSADRRVAVTTVVHNPLPTSGMDEYVIGSCYVPGLVSRCFEGQPGENRTWFSLWASPLLEITDFDSDDGSSPNSLGASFRDLRVVDHLQVTPSESTSRFAFDATGRAPLRRDVDSVVYELQWWRQAKATPDLLQVQVAPPRGWAVDRVEVVGGGSGMGMGVHGSGEELTADIVDGAARMRGTVTADTRLAVHLVDAP